ncbi:MAG TPA: hypothetical protein V6D17_21460 [Candidatus Obscuribacterales bacterium]
MNMQYKRKNGSVLLLVLILVAMVVVPLLIVLSQAGLYDVDRGRIQSIVEGAGLVAANDLSRAIINDANFGYVSLSNYPPAGKGTCAPDGEPLPVIGINTLVGTIRQNAIIGRELNNPTICALADADWASLQSTIADMNVAFKDLVSGSAKRQYFDIHGAKVDVMKDVTKFLSANLPKNVKLESVRLTNGWLQGGSSSTIEVPKPDRLARIKAGDCAQGNYRAFVDIPIDNRDFSFAGVGSSSALVSPANFRQADSKHICSIVKVEVVVRRKNVNSSMPGSEAASRIRCVAACQPFALPDEATQGVMTLRFTGQPVPGLMSWRDFLATNNFRDHQITIYDVVGGDYPTDKGSSMQEIDADAPVSTAQQFAEHLYCWLRNGHVRPRIDAVLEMVQEPFRSAPGALYVYEFTKAGRISRRVMHRNPFPIGVTADAQSSTFVDTRTQTGYSPIIIFRDNVRYLGSQAGGKHGGQPLAGNPLNWCELPEYGGDEQTAKELGKGKLGKGVVLVDPLGGATTKQAINDEWFSLFKRLDGSRLALQPRRSFYSGGLAVDIEIGGLRPSTAARDVLTMRQLKR